jgi:hypothetical protein
MPTTIVHTLEPGQTEIRGDIDCRHKAVVPDWELHELLAAGDRPPVAPPLEWGGTGLMAAGMGVDGSAPLDDEPEDDWELELLEDPEVEAPEPSEDVFEWIVDPDDWELESLEASGDKPPIAPPLEYTGTGLMAAGMGVDGSSSGDDDSDDDDSDDWELESLDLADDTEGEPEDKLED